MPDSKIFLDTNILIYAYDVSGVKIQNPFV